MVTPNPDSERPKELKQWHTSITTDQRSHLVNLMLLSERGRGLDAILSLRNEVVTEESHIYETASTLIEYYHLLAEKIRQIELGNEERLLEVLEWEHRHGLQQLMAMLRGPTSPNQQQEILRILNSNPPLMAAFIRQRQNAAVGAHVAARFISGPNNAN